MRIVVRAPNWIGDAVLALPAIERLHLSSPAAEIWIAGPQSIKDLFLALGHIEGFIPLTGPVRINTFLAAVKAIRKGRFDAGLLLTNSFVSALVFFLAGIPQRWGYARDGRGFLLTRKLAFQKSGRSHHQAEYYHNLVSSLGFSSPPHAFRFRIDRPLQGG